MWQGVAGHDDVVERFRLALARGRLASTFLFVGPPGIGKRMFAQRFAQALLCQAKPPEQLDPCGACPACEQVLASVHPDLHVIQKPADRSFIPLALFIGEAGKRLGAGLCHAISLKPFMGGRRIAIVDDADYLNEEGANCLLKTLEEPPPHSVLILIGTSADKQLPTIRSRCQIVRFDPLSAEVVERLALAEGLAADADEAKRLAAYSEGSLERARNLADRELWAFRRELLGALSAERFESVRLAQQLVPFVDAAGKEASARRSRARQVVNFAVEFYRRLLRTRAGTPAADDAELQAFVTQALRAGQHDEERAAVRLERSLDALAHIDRNANQATLLECWLDDLATATATPAGAR